LERVPSINHSRSYRNLFCIPLPIHVLHRTSMFMSCTRDIRTTPHARRSHRTRANLHEFVGSVGLPKFQGLQLANRQLTWSHNTALDNRGGFLTSPHFVTVSLLRTSVPFTTAEVFCLHFTSSLKPATTKAKRGPTSPRTYVSHVSPLASSRAITSLA
jgi:hypothetical protein